MGHGRLTPSGVSEQASTTTTVRTLWLLTLFSHSSFDASSTRTSLALLTPSWHLRLICASSVDRDDNARCTFRGDFGINFC